MKRDPPTNGPYSRHSSGSNVCALNSFDGCADLQRIQRPQNAKVCSTSVEKVRTAAVPGGVP